MSDIKNLEILCKNLLKILPNFDITDKNILPYGLKPHTRSVSWLVEQVIYNLIYACFGISFDNIRVNFSKDHIVLFSPQFMPIYINPRNDKIQATYNHEMIIRTR